MRITHIIRGEEHLSNTPKQILLYEAFGYTLPLFAHVPLILGPDGNKLSKRDAATSVLDYKRAGYLPEALINYLARLGWSHGDQEIFTTQELISYFDLDHVGKKGAIFDTEKLDWVNSMYIRALPAQGLYDYIIATIDPHIEQRFAPWGKEKIIECIALYRDRIKTIGELLEILDRLHLVPKSYNETDVTAWVTPEALEHLELLKGRLTTLDHYTADEIRSVIKRMCKEFDIQLVAVAQPVRLALVGTTASPGIFELMALLGKEESLRRTDSLVDWVRRGKAA
jgi:glutamyl-tRNA synthetase